MSTLIKASTVAEDGFAVTQKPCNVLDVQVISNDDTNTLYLMLFDADITPTAGAVPRWRAVVPPEQHISISFSGQDPHNYSGALFDKGLVCVLSTTKDTLTATATSAGFFQVHYRLRNRGRG